MTTVTLQPLSQFDLQSLSQRLKDDLQAMYGDAFDSLLLYGSYARGDFRTDSDVDYLVVLKQDAISFGQEVDRISPFTSQLGLNYTVYVSAKPVTASAYYRSERLFYQAVRREGIVV